MYIQTASAASTIAVSPPGHEAMPTNHLGDIDAARSASALIAITLQQAEKMDKSG